VTHNAEPIVVEKNRKRALWSLIIILFFVPISGWLVYLGLQPGRPDVSWALVLFGVIGLVAFTASALRVIHTMRAPWRLVLSSSQLAIYTPYYDLVIPWQRIVGIAVDEVSRRPGCALIFDDIETTVDGAKFHGQASRPDIVTDARTMQARMKETREISGYHLGIPGRILELGPDELADLLAKARTGDLWPTSHQD
jgi:hypothetical protein